MINKKTCTSSVQIVAPLHSGGAAKARRVR